MKARSSLALVLLASLLGGCTSTVASPAPSEPLLDTPTPPNPPGGGDGLAPAGVKIVRSIVVQKDRAATMNLASLLGAGLRSAAVRTNGRQGAFRVEGSTAVYTPTEGSEGVDVGIVQVQREDDGTAVDIEVHADVRPCLRVPADLKAVPELHVVGVYESARNDGQAKEANQLGSIDVTIGKTDTPVSLVLSSYEGVTWQLHLEEGARIAQIVVSGYYANDTSVVGVPADTPITKEAFTSLAYGWEPAANTGGGSYRSMIDAVRSKFGGTETSFQGAYRGHAFRIPFDAASLGVGSGEGTISHYSFADQKCDDACRPRDVPGGIWPASTNGPLDKYVLESDGVTARNASANLAVVRSARGVACGKHYFELSLTPPSASSPVRTRVGVLVGSDANTRSQLLVAPGVYQQSLINVTSDRIGVALDLDRGEVYYRDASGWLTPGLGPIADPDRQVTSSDLGATGARMDLWTYDPVHVGADLPLGATVRYVDRDFQYGLPTGFAPGL